MYLKEKRNLPLVLSPVSVSSLERVLLSSRNPSCVLVDFGAFCDSVSETAAEGATSHAVEAPEGLGGILEDLEYWGDSLLSLPQEVLEVEEGGLEEEEELAESKGYRNKIA